MRSVRADAKDMSVPEYKMPCEQCITEDVYCRPFGRHIVYILSHRADSVCESFSANQQRYSGNEV